MFRLKRVALTNSFATRIRRLFREAWVTPLSAGLLSLIIVFARTDLWRRDLSVPINYSGDALFETVMVKALVEGTWNYHIARLGSPFGMDVVDFPVGRTLDFALIKTLSTIFRNPFLLINLYWLLTIAMASAFACLLLRSLRISSASSVCFGVLYGLIPFVFYRNIAHLNLVHFMVPGAAFLGISLAQGKKIIFQRRRLHTHAGLRRHEAVFWFGICIALGLVYAYWAFFGCIVIFLGCLIGYCRTRNKDILLTALLLIALIGAAAVADVTASLIYWKQHGSSTALNYKYPAEADIYGLKIRQMLTPIAEHPLRILRYLRDRIISAKFPNDDNESATSALGVIGGFGFLSLMLIAVARPRGRLWGDHRLRILSGMVVALVLIAEVGGFGSLFNIFILHEFRCYNRISPFVSLFSLIAVAVVIDHVFAGPLLSLRYVILPLMLLFGAVDQVATTPFNSRADNERRFYEDKNFIRQLESRIPPAMMVFQLPHTGFPPDGVHLRMGPYDNARAYLHSRVTSWSWGAMDGRHHEWSKATANMPLPQFLERIVFSGFTGLLIDRYGFPDSSTESAIVNAAAPGSNFDLGGRWVFIDLRSVRDKYLQGLSEPERVQRQTMARHPVYVEWLDRFSVEEQSGHTTWHWCGKEGTIRLVNDSDENREIEVSGYLQQYSGGSAQVVVTRNGARHSIILSAGSVAYSDQFAIPRHGATEIHFEFVGELLHAPEDSRELAFQLQNFQYRELESTTGSLSGQIPSER